MVADEAKDVLVSWKNKKAFTTQDEALENLLIEFKEQKCPNCGYQNLED
jgi:hypothetical protein